MPRRKRKPKAFDGTYETFRTGLTFREVRRVLWVNNDDRSTWRYKRRRTVLGFWHQLKLQLWAQYLDAQDGERRSA
jgi:hypothetical protein